MKKVLGLTILAALFALPTFAQQPLTDAQMTTVQGKSFTFINVQTITQRQRRGSNNKQVATQINGDANVVFPIIAKFRL